MWKKTNIPFAQKCSIELFIRDVGPDVEICIFGELKGARQILEHDILRGSISQLKLDQTGRKISWEEAGIQNFDFSSLELDMAEARKLMVTAMI